MMRGLSILWCRSGRSEWACPKSLVSCHLSSIRCIKLPNAAVNPMDLLLSNLTVSRKNWDISSVESQLCQTFELRV